MTLVTNIALPATRAESSGVDAWSVANTYPAMVIDFNTGRSKLSELTDVSAWRAVKPISVRLVWEARKAVSFSLLGFGGATAENVLDHTSIGPSAVQVGTASIADPGASEALIESLGALVRTVKRYIINELD